MGATFVGGAAIAGDSLLHNPDTMATVRNSSKTTVIGNRVAVAQAGQFTGTERVMDELEKLNPSAVTPQDVVDCIVSHAGQIHADRTKTGGSLETFYLVGGVEEDGNSVIVSIAIHQNEVKRFSGPGQMIAIGTQLLTQQRAFDAFNSSVRPGSNIVELDTWVRRVVADESTASPQTVGFPATLLVIRRENAIEAHLETTGEHDGRLAGFIP